MWVWLRFVIVCLVALTLPIQAMASATMVRCGPGHQGTHAATSDQARHSPASHEHQTNRAEPPHSHEVTAADAAPDAASPGLYTAQTETFTKLTNDKCSACASCCSACAIVSAFPRVPVPDVAPTVFVATAPAVEAPAADGPDRPPRVLLA
jgi:hypothetical protein